MMTTDTYFFLIAGMAGLQVHVGPVRVRRRDGDLCPVGAHLAARHHSIQ
jgi:hypothetical protein